MNRLMVVALVVAMSGCAAVGSVNSPTGHSRPSQTIEFYNPDGARSGYGEAKSGTVEFFNPDSSRAGYGKVGPGGTVEFFNPNSSRSGFGKMGK